MTNVDRDRSLHALYGYCEVEPEQLDRDGQRHVHQGGTIENQGRTIAGVQLDRRSCGSEVAYRAIMTFCQRNGVALVRSGAELARTGHGEQACAVGYVNTDAHIAKGLSALG